MKNYRQLTKRSGRHRLGVFLNFIICFLMVAVASFTRDGKLMGHEFGADSQQVVSKNDTISRLADGEIIINTAAIGKDITGFGGTVPLEITIQKGIVKDIKALPNKETPEFFGRAKTLFNRWRGKTVAEASSMKVDGVSGATFSSRAIIGNMRAGLQVAAKQTEKKPLFADFDGSAKNLCGLAVALLAPLPHGSTGAQCRRAWLLVWLFPVLVRHFRLYVQRHECRGFAAAAGVAHCGFYLPAFREGQLLLQSCLPLW